LVNVQNFTECIYKQQIDYVSLDFIVYALSGLPEFNERNVAWEKIEACGFHDVFGEDQTPIVRKHTPKYYAYVNDDKPSEYWDYPEFKV
jgi:hypothetical protein